MAREFRVREGERRGGVWRCGGGGAAGGGADLKIEMGLESLFSLFVRLGGERLVTLGEEDNSGRGPSSAG